MLGICGIPLSDTIWYYTLNFNLPWKNLFELIIKKINIFKLIERTVIMLNEA